MASETPEKVNRHWADEVAEQVLASGRPPVISTGISPSGDIHIGNMREVLTGDAVYRALRERTDDVHFNYVADNFDPLRKVYPFLDPEVFGPLVGQPLSEIPCPCGEHSSYSDHFLEPFLHALRELRVDVEVERADEMYKSGRMNPYIAKALDGRDRIASILNELTGKEIRDDWSPFTPWCPSCRRIDHARVTGHSSSDQEVGIECECGHDGRVPMAGGGKLRWRIDWPARWMMLGVTVEPFGKDHSARGGSYDTGARIVREVFDGEPPFPIPYEWIRLKGQGDMSSSRGNVLSIETMLDVVPPMALRYMVMRERPQRAINFDPGPPLLRLVDEVDDRAARARDDRALELSRAGSFEPLGIPFQHVVVVAQIVDFDVDRAVEVLRRSGSEVSADALAARMPYARRWLERFADDSQKYTVSPELPAEAGNLDPDQRRFLGELATRLDPDMEGEAVHKLIYETATSRFAETKPATLFQAIYVALLGKPRGPRAGWFIALLGSAFCAQRFGEASGGVR